MGRNITKGIKMAGTNLVRFNKNGEMEVDGVVFDIREFINKIDKKVNLFIQDNKPDEYGILDFWYAPTEDILSISKFVGEKLVWVEANFAGKTLTESITSSSGGISQSALDILANSLSNQIESVRSTLTTSLNNTAVLGDCPPWHLLKGNLSLSNTLINNGASVTIATGLNGLNNYNLGMDMISQWGNDASEKYGGMVLIKSRINTDPFYILDTTMPGYALRPTAALGVKAVTHLTYTSTGVSSLYTLNDSVYQVPFQTTHVKTGFTNHGKAYVCHYNPTTLFSITKFIGSGSIGHAIPHHLGEGRSPSTVWVKDIDTAEDWEVYQNGNYSNLGNTLAAGGQTQFWDSEFVYDGGNLSHFNRANTSHVLYCWGDAYYDDNSNLIGNYQTTFYGGNGGVGSEVVVKLHAKPLLIMIRGAGAGSNRIILDCKRDDFTNPLFLNLGDAEPNWGKHIDVIGDKLIISGNDIDINKLGCNYNVFVIFDNDNGSGFSKYTKATDTTNLNINNALVPFAIGIDNNLGKLTKIISKNQTISGLTLSPGENYVWMDKEGNFGSYSTLNYGGTVPTDYKGGNTPVFFEEENAWYENCDLYYNKGNNIAGWNIDTALGNPTLYNSNNRIVIKNNANTTGQGLVYKTLNNLVVGQWYRVVVYLYYSTDVYNHAWVSNETGVNSWGNAIVRTPTDVGCIRGTPTILDFQATSSTSYLYIDNNGGGTNTYSEWKKIAVFPVDVLPLQNNSWLKKYILKPSLGTVITNSRNFLSTIVKADENGQLVSVREHGKYNYKTKLMVSELIIDNGFDLRQGISYKTSERNLGAYFYNRTGKPMWVSVRTSNTVANSTFNTWCYVSGGLVAGHDMISTHTIGYNHMMHQFFVPVGGSYLVMGTQALLVEWVEIV